jgi:hypothetical protein
MPTEMLSPHFSLAEFTVSETAARQGLSNEPATQRHMDNLRRTAETMEKVRTILSSKPIIVTSGYRSPPVNAAVGGSSTSAHCSGLGCDFVCPGFGTATAVCRVLLPHLQALDIDQLIDEYPPTGWCHIGLTEGQPRHMVLTIDQRGTRTGIA